MSGHVELRSRQQRRLVTDKLVPVGRVLIIARQGFELEFAFRLINAINEASLPDKRIDARVSELLCSVLSVFCSVCVLFCLQLWSSKQNRTAHTTRSDVPVEKEHVDAPLTDDRHVLGGQRPHGTFADFVVLTVEEHGDGDAAAHSDRCAHLTLTRNKDLVQLVVHEGSLGELRRCAPGAALATSDRPDVKVMSKCSVLPFQSYRTRLQE